MIIYEQIRQIAISDNYFSLRYILEENFEDYVSFGIKVVMTDLKTGSCYDSVAKDITTELETAEEIYNKIFDGIVTPTTLTEVVEDLICEVLLSEVFIGMAVS